MVNVDLNSAVITLKNVEKRFFTSMIYNAHKMYAEHRCTVTGEEL